MGCRFLAARNVLVFLCLRHWPSGIEVAHGADDVNHFKAGSLAVSNFKKRRGSDAGYDSFDAVD
jgi:hypothetical protein